MSKAHPLRRALLSERGIDLAALRAAVAGICDKRSREREQADCQHDERAVHARDLVHRVPPFRVIEFLPITLGEGANRAVTIR
jgi:hypothetical protein